MTDLARNKRHITGKMVTVVKIGRYLNPDIRQAIQPSVLSKRGYIKAENGIGWWMPMRAPSKHLVPKPPKRLLVTALASGHISHSQVMLLRGGKVVKKF